MLRAQRHVLVGRCLGIVAVVVAATGTVLSACGGDDELGAYDVGDASVDSPSAEEGGTRGDAGRDARPSAEDACRAYFAALCGRSKGCKLPVTDACMAVAAACPDALLGPRSTNTLDGIIACTATLDDAGCDDIVAGRIACLSPGTAGANEPCAFDSECKSEACSGTNKGGCGTCAGLRPPGTGCPPLFGSEWCGPGKECVTDAGGCLPIAPPSLLAVGAACPGSDAGECPFEAPCTAPTPASSVGTCRPAPRAGQPCAVTLPSKALSCAEGLGCVVANAFVDGGVPPGSVPTCEAAGGADAPCHGRNQPACREGFYCSNPTGYGRCLAAKGYDAGCTTSRECDDDLYCERLTASSPARACRTASLPGEYCGDFLANEAGAPQDTVRCVSGAVCEQGPSLSDTCFGYGVGPNGACHPDSTFCAPGFACSSSGASAGTCQRARCIADAGSD